MNRNKENTIRRLMYDIREITDKELPTGLALRVSNKIDKISLILKRDRTRPFNCPEKK